MHVEKEGIAEGCTAAWLKLSRPQADLLTQSRRFFPSQLPLIFKHVQFTLA